MSRRVTVRSEVKHEKCGAGAKASLNRAKQLRAVDAKLGDLVMARVKRG